MAPTQQQSKAARAKVLAGGKTPKARVTRYLKSTTSTLKEGGKNVLLLKGIRCSDSMGTLLRELRAIAAPNSKLLSKKNQIVAFDPSESGQQSLDFLTTKNDAALFGLASHNKKRPNNLVLGRTFDRSILDMAELGIQYFKTMANYGGSVPKKRIGSKPLLLFVGDVWTQSPDARNLQNLLTDFYKGDVVDQLIVSGLDHLIVFNGVELPDNGGSSSDPASAHRFRVHQRTYFMKLKKAATDGSSSSSTTNGTPRPHLTPCGPDMDFILRRTQWADADLYKAARRLPTATRSKKVKNHSTNLFGETVGRLHLSKQNVDKMQGRKSKALRRAEKQAAEEEQQAVEQELEQEGEELKREFQQTFGFEESETNTEKGKRKGRS